MKDPSRNESKAFFHFGDPMFRSEDFELLLAENLCLIVDIDTLRCTEIRQGEPGINAKFGHQTIQLKAGVADSWFVGIGIRSKGYIEVHDGSEMKLWYDRFRWRARPYHKLNECINQFFGTEIARNTIRDTISVLLDRQLSSIIAFVPNNLSGATVQDELQIESLRQHVADRDKMNDKTQRLGIVGNRIEDLSVDTLVAITRLDGAHVLDQKGFLAIAQRVKSESGADPTKSTTKLGGTGSIAARQLANRIPSPGFVVKVSSSGSLYVLRGSKNIVQMTFGNLESMDYQI